MTGPAALSALAPGLADPAHDAQRIFRAVLEATAHPGRIVTLPAAPAGPGTLSPAAVAYLLTIADRDTPVWLDAPYDRAEIRDFLRFHAGAPVAAGRSDATFAVLPADMPGGFADFAVGSDAYPDRSATLVVEVPALAGGRERLWRGPGINGSARVAIDGPDDGFWRAWAENRALFPAGVDVVFTAGQALCALPRGIAVEV
ncbi:phosphonate C-P lyase system protein PhnH [Reyranella sp.]|uniref:phosphonate C-P lyase system protein PhnH n=1 Tax=Reyranella sp. TaxID=1929291 RepID=UPI003BAA5431